ncbi:MAG: hypothetical protein AAGD00_02655 [Planctomycetota bacterium]
MQQIEPDDRALIEWLASHDESCPACGYRLRGLERTTCPECAHALRLTVGAPDVRLAAWFVAIVGFALAAGFDGVVATILTVGVGAAWVTGGHVPLPDVWIVLASFAGAAALMLGGSVWIFRSRARWMRWSLARRIRWAALIVAGVFLVHAAAGFWLLTHIN